MPRLDLLERQPAALLHQVDEPEVARAEHDDVLIGDVVLGPLGLLPRRLADGVADHRALLVPAGDPGDLAAREGALDELVEAVPVALLEGRTLRLPVVGKHDDLVWPRGVPARSLDLREAVVELAQGLERVGPLEARVVRHLVVARERRVDGRPPSHHVGEHAGHDEVAHEDAERRPHQGVDAASVAARPHVTADGTNGRGPLEDHLPQEQHEGARHVVTVGEECPIARVGPLLRLHPADREDHVIRLAGEKVSAARAAIDQKADARAEAPLDLGAVRRRRARHQRRGLLLHPAEGRDVVVRSQQDPRLTGTRLRGEIGLPLGQTMRVVGQPAGHGRGVAVTHRPAQHGQCEPIDLEEEDPGDVGAGDDPLPTRDPSAQCEASTCRPSRGRPRARRSQRRPRARQEAPSRSCRR